MLAWTGRPIIAPDSTSGRRGPEFLQFSRATRAAKLIISLVMQLYGIPVRTQHMASAVALLDAWLQAQAQVRIDWGVQVLPTQKISYCK